MRTYQGTIARIEDLEFDIKFRIKDNKPLYVKWKEDFGGAYVQKELIVNHSKDPKDLVQAGDLVYYTIKGLEHSTYVDIVAEHTDARTLEKTLRARMYKLEQLNIKKILTKEQINENIFEVVE